MISPAFTDTLNIKKSNAKFSTYLYDIGDVANETHKSIGTIFNKINSLINTWHAYIRQ